MSEERSCGILMHITSLPSKHGIGTLGAESYKFVDFLKKAGQQYWQILPIGPTGYGDSPYQCYSAYAGNPLLIDIDMLIEDGLVSPDDQDLMIIDKKENFADYAQLFSFKNVILQKAYTRFTAEGAAEEKLAFDKFCRKNAYWLGDYALFMSLKYHFKLKMWTQWDEDIIMRKPDSVKKYTAKLSEEIKCQKFMQFIFFKQYKALKKYANKNGIKIFGDMPIYVSMDSADVWSSPELFCLDDKKRPTAVAGCPPDYFSPTGQLWGNPLYNWDKMEKDGYKWWISRIKYSSRLFDITRIDHFRGFESYYAIPAGSETAEHGKWLKGPSNKLFEAVKAKLGDVPLVAEDLGFLTDDVRRMLKKAGYPGMNVLEFAFSADKENSSYLPHNYIENSVVYIGTHDNQTAMGWYASLDEKTRKFVNKYLDIREGDSPAWKLIAAAYMSVSRTAIIQMQDFLEIGDEGRMNIPSTVGGGNWAWRMEEGCLSKKLAKRIRKLAKLYFRTKPKVKNNKKDKEDTPAKQPEESVLPETNEDDTDPVLTESITEENTQDIAETGTETE